jgi:hypothetical protein
LILSAQLRAEAIVALLASMVMVNLKPLVLLLVQLALLNLANGRFLRSDDDAPWFCHGLDCPRYTVGRAWPDDQLELRAYDEGQWVSTNVTDMRYDSAIRLGFMVGSGF